MEDLFCGQQVEQDADAPSDQPNFSDCRHALLFELHITWTLLTIWVVSFFLVADSLLCDVQGLRFSKYTLNEPVLTSGIPQAFTPPYSMILCYGLSSILGLCIGLFQVLRQHTQCFLKLKSKLDERIFSVNLQILLLTEWFIAPLHFSQALCEK